MNNVLAARNLTIQMAGRELVRGLELDINPGEILAILGRNGSGKTTLLHTLAGLRAPAAGSIDLRGEPIATMAPQKLALLRGVLLQQQLDAFPSTVLETALIGRHPWLDRWAWETSTDAEIAQSALNAVGLAEFAARDVHTLSGGERQRLAIATLLTQEPRLAFLDEPLAHLDLNHQIGVLDLFSYRAKETGMAVVMVLHDINLARRYTQRALLLFGDGRTECGPVAEVLNADTLSRLYGHRLRRIAVDGGDYFIPE
jgi:iron complex transport system ATP-binding protein